ncbi:hypothetical protein [Paenibacillus wulumuqiensis]|uniref:hypothetical protein n=1 Tax=Paenibacillus wulumuqiensis TaxID=1567107 RepID=UPI0006193E71|nr:hypothetical protein [Paenibacillus wulumuqiensis]
MMWLKGLFLIVYALMVGMAAVLLAVFIHTGPMQYFLHPSKLEQVYTYSAHEVTNKQHEPRL